MIDKINRHVATSIMCIKYIRTCAYNQLMRMSICMSNHQKSTKDAVSAIPLQQHSGIAVLSFLMRGRRDLRTSGENVGSCETIER